MASLGDRYTYKHIVVVHGIGEQKPNETSLGFMNEFLRALPRQRDRYSVDVHNLIESVDEVTRFRPAYVVFRDHHQNLHHVIGFSEVYWQPVVNEYLKRNDNNPPIPIFTWARSINARLLDRPGRVFRRGREVIDNLETMLALLRRLATVYRKSELLANTLTRFLGDVQMYAESDGIRQSVNNSFLSVMARVKRFSDEVRGELLSRQIETRQRLDWLEFEDYKVYVVAHSEGTVVAFNSLVQAAVLAEGAASHPQPEHRDLFRFEEELLKDKEKGPNAERASEWLPRVAALVTLGSPIDKHYTIWSNRFRNDHLKQDRPQKIRWFNYWDVNDPVGYGLKAVFDGSGTDARKLFTVQYDSGFSRYSIPGAAHVEYWADYGIYEHVIDQAMELGTTRRDTTVRSRWWCDWGVRPADVIAYSVARIAALAAMLGFANRLLSVPALDGAREAFAAPLLSQMTVWPAGVSWLSLAVWLLVPLLIIKGLRRLSTWSADRRDDRSPQPRTGWRQRLEDLAEASAWCVTGLWFFVAAVFCLGYNCNPCPSTTVKDWLGYLAGFVIAWLAWRLHTTVHNGLIQMWHYTKGTDTSAAPASR